MQGTAVPRHSTTAHGNRDIVRFTVTGWGQLAGAPQAKKAANHRVSNPRWVWTIGWRKNVSAKPTICATAFKTGMNWSHDQPALALPRLPRAKPPWNNSACD